MIRKKIGEKEVIKFLKNNPDFFLKNMQLLDYLEFPQNFENKNNEVIFFKDWILNSIKRKYNELLSDVKHNFFTQKKILETTIKLLKIKSKKEFSFYLLNEIENDLEVDCFILASSNNEILKFGGIFFETSILNKVYNNNKIIIMDAIDQQVDLFKYVNKKIYSNAIFSLRVSLFEKPTIIVLGSCKKIFLENKGTEFVSFIGKVIEEKIEQLKHT